MKALAEEDKEGLVQPEQAPEGLSCMQDLITSAQFNLGNAYYYGKWE